MLSIEIIDRIRAQIGDPYVSTMDEITTDGVNASWVLTNHPVQRASESVFVSGENQASYNTLTTLDGNVALGDYTVVVASNPFTLGDQIVFQNPSDQLVDPAKFEISEIDGTTLTLNRRLDRYCLDGWNVDKVTKGWTIDYLNGIVFFEIAPDVDVRMTVSYAYTKYSDSLLNTLWTDAANLVTIDTGEAFSLTNDSHVTLAILNLHIAILNKDITENSDGAIKIRQGSTSLDLSGQTKSLDSQLKQVQARYDLILARYQMGLLDSVLGISIVGSEDNINA